MLFAGDHYTKFSMGEVPQAVADGPTDVRLFPARTGAVPAPGNLPPHVRIGFHPREEVARAGRRSLRRVAKAAAWWNTPGSMMTWCIANASLCSGWGSAASALLAFQNKQALLDALALTGIARDARRALRTADKQRIKIDNCD